MARRRANVLWPFVFLAGVVWLALSVLAPDVLWVPPLPQGRDDPWASAEACGRLVSQGKRAPREPGGVRVVSWNLRWFPDGTARRPGGRPADVAWLACAITWLGADVLAAQEVKADPPAAARWEALLLALSEGGGGRWRSALDTCPRDGRGHVALAWDEARVEVEAVDHHASLNGAGGGPCKDRLRPGLSAYLRGVGLDLSVVTVHADSGREERDARRRAAAADALSAVAADLTARRGDPDLLVVGDFNAMGTEAPSLGLTADAEQARLAASLGAGTPALRSVPTEGAACSHYYRGRPSALDLAYATDDLSASLEVAGYCSTLGCRPMAGALPEAYERLSDHCPIVVDLPARK